MAAKRLDALVARDYEDGEGQKRTSWTKIGAAWEGKDGSWAISLDALPVPSLDDKGRLQCRILLREPLPPRDEKPRSSRGSDQPF